jgi:hypothetical protein
LSNNITKNIILDLFKISKNRNDFVFIIKKLTACYLVRQKIKLDSNVRLYNYTFENPLDITTIKLLKKREYRLKKKEFE